MQFWLNDKAKTKSKKDTLFSPGIEPGTFCVLDRCDNRYTTKTACSQWQDGSKRHISSGTSRAVLTFVLHMPCADCRLLTAVIV